MGLPDLTIGIEEEYQIIDPRSRELSPHNKDLVEHGQRLLGEQIKPEFMQSQVEVGTRVCGSIAEARQEVGRLRRTVCELAEKEGLTMAAASTHPFSSWSEQLVTAGERYTQLQEDLRDVARRLLIFGMHVHVGIPDPELRIDVMNQARYFMPHVLALSTSSPFWQGRDTGLKSYRSVIFENMPRSGLPPTFRSWSDYDDFVATLVRTGCIDEPTKIWWDIRPHPKFPTLEFRISDVATRIDEVLCIAALLQALVATLLTLRQNNRTWRLYRHHLITENKWRAVRYGLDGRLIDFGKQQEVPVRFLARELLELVDGVLDELGSRREVAYAETILSEGSSADRQLQTYRESGDLKAVVDRLVSETREGLD
ncbi:MAG: carboxylate-amine ligase [Acidobacteria bacterium]|nr:MAG: carboxylate-amine ligase [Acidobacteriota bacterium]